MLLWNKGSAGILWVILGLDIGKIDLVGITPAAALLPDQVPLRQSLERRRHTLLADAEFLRQFLPGEDHKDLALVVGPAVPAGELEAVQEKCIGHLGVQTHVRIPGVREQPAGHLHMVNILYVRLPHQREIRTLFHLCGPHEGHLHFLF